jgi:hypothetical protein
MKARHLQRMLVVAAVAGLALSVSTALARDATNVAQAAAVAPVPPLAYGVSDILKLAQAKVSDDAIIAYIKNRGNSYGLNADQIIYLRQQGVSDAVILAMLNQPKPGVAPATVPMPTSPAPQPVAATANGQPAEPYVESEPTVYYDYEPSYYPVYSYDYWPWPVAVSYGWGGYWHRGWHRGGVWHGGSAWHGRAVVHSGGGGWHRGGNAGSRR